MAGKASKSDSTEARGSSTKTTDDKAGEIAKAIIAEAEGITCKDCPFATFYPGGTGYCHRATDLFTGEFLRTSERAPACKHHPRLKALKASIETR